MKVTDIVNRAAMNCGVASSFNPDEVPEDIQARGADILRHEVIPSMNCDRTLDLTEIVYPGHPENGIIDLVCPPQDYEGFIVGCVPETYDTLTKKEYFNTPAANGYYYPNIRKLLIRQGYTEAGMPTTLGKRTDKWPADQFGNYEPLWCWTSDYKLVNISVPSSDTADRDNTLLDERYTLPFPPMRVEAIVRAADGAPFQYLHQEEMVSAEFRYAQLVFTTEDHPGLLRVRFNPSQGDESVQLVIPVPVQLVNSRLEPEPWRGTIVAPDKFRMFLVAKLAHRLAVEYGLDTAPMMAQLASESYQALVKNLSKRHHAQDTVRKISAYLERNRGWRAGANDNGYGGGFNG